MNEETFIWGLADFFLWIWNNTWQATVLMGMVWLAQWLFRKKLPPQWSYVLSLLILVRLLLPAVPASRFSVFSAASLFRHSQSVVETGLRRRPETVSFAQPQSEHRAATPSEASQGIQAAREPSRSEVFGTFWRRAATIPCGCIWMLGFAVSLLLPVRQHCSMSAWVRRQTVVVESTLTSLLEDCRRTLRIKRAIRILFAPGLSTPAVFGWRRPVLLLPEGMPRGLDKAELRMIFLHELMHVRRGDVLVNWAVIVARALHWFNPLVWLALRWLRADQELACDQAVLARLADSERPRYGHTLLKLLSSFPQRTSIPGLAPLGLQSSNLKRRIGLIAVFRPARRAITVLSAALVILIASLTFTRRADLTRIAPAAWGSIDTATRMSGTVAGDILIMSYCGPVPSRKVPFRIAVDGEKWSARVDYRTNNYQLAGFDGSKSGMVLVDPKPDPSQPERNMCAAEIYGSSYAAGADPAIRLAWLAFAAAPFFRSTNSSDFTALWNMGLMDPVAHAIRISRVEFIPGSPDLPSTVDMVVSTQTVLRDIMNVPNLSPFVSPPEVKKAMRHLWPYDNRLCARYQVLSTTNFQGKLFPLTFELSVYEIMFPFGNRIVAKYRGTIRSITADVPRTFLPNPGWAVEAQDWRFVDRIRRIDRIWTRVTDGIWPEKDDPELQERFRRLQTECQGVNEKTPYPDAASFYGKNTVGHKPRIQFTALDGREVDLARLKGKVVLLDFWATWCGPCLAGIPELQEVYDKFHDRGLEVVAISLDTDRPAIERFVKEKGLPWPQYYDGKGWDNAIAAKYGIHAVPTLWLLGRDGKVVDQDVRFDLTEKVTKLVAEQ